MVDVVGPDSCENFFGREIVIERCEGPDTGRNTTSDVTEADCDPDGGFDPAHVVLTPKPMVNSAKASVHAAITKAFASVV